MQKEIQKIDLGSYDYKRSMLFCGATGTGKTYQATRLLELYKDSELNEKKSKLDIYAITDGYFKQMIKSNMIVLRKPDEWQQDIKYFPLELMLRCKILLYDDIGVSDTSDAYLRDLTFILDERTRKGLVTIYTTNLNKDELQNKLNERIVSRILYNTDVVVFKGDDMRLKTTNYFEI